MVPRPADGIYAGIIARLPMCSGARMLVPRAWRKNPQDLRCRRGAKCTEMNSRDAGCTSGYWQHGITTVPTNPRGCWVVKWNNYQNINASIANRDIVVAGSCQDEWGYEELERKFGVRREMSWAPLAPNAKLAPGT